MEALTKKQKKIQERAAEVIEGYLAAKGTRGAITALVEQMAEKYDCTIDTIRKDITDYKNKTA